ncbi:MAG: DUF1365 domain-containing protein, partial [Pseudomonadota bacterium]
PIRLLTHLRYFGYCMNPVSFYYCFDPDGTTLRYLIAEVHNTPWGETHCYPFDVEAGKPAPKGGMHFSFDKAFHVSPFMPMSDRYEWTFWSPTDSLAVGMSSHTADGRSFQASLNLSATPISGRSLARVLSAYPFMTFKVIGAIYFEAMRLKLKRVPFYPHPKHQTQREGLPHESS